MAALPPQCTFLRYSSTPWLSSSSETRSSLICRSSQSSFIINGLHRTGKLRNGRARLRNWDNAHADYYIMRREGVRCCSSTGPSSALPDPFDDDVVDNDVNGDDDDDDDNEGNHEDFVGIVRELPLLALSMTAGNDVLFPGCHQVANLDEETADYVKSLVSEDSSDPQEFAYIPLNAWGDAGKVGTIAIVEDISPPADSIEDADFKSEIDERRAIIICSGVARIRVHSISDDMHTARVEMFNDDTPTDEKFKEIEALEQRLVTAMKDIVTLSIKISDDDSHTREKALEDTLNRVESLYTQNDHVQDSDFWMMQLTATLRRELLSFIVVDMLSVSFMDRRSILEGTDTADRLEIALKGLEPFVKELAAKGAIVGALGRGGDESSSSGPEETSPSSSSPPSS